MDSDNWRVKRGPPATPRDQAFGRSDHQRGSNNDDGYERGLNNHGDYKQHGSSIYRGYGRNREYDQQSQGRTPQREASGTLRKPLDNTKAEQAIEECRRLYVGNMQYRATARDVEALFSEVAAEIEDISMSVDPLTGRNPSYCFIDFTSKDIAAQVMERFDGVDFMDRPLKVRLGVKTSRAGHQGMNTPSHAGTSGLTPSHFDRWRRLEDTDKMNKALEEGRRLYVGGLPRFKDQEFANLKIKELFRGFSVDVIGKLITPHKSKIDEPGNHHYCFVDLRTANGADAAIRQLDGLEVFGGNLKISRAHGTSKKLGERRTLYVGGLPQFQNQDSIETAMSELFEGYIVKSVSKQYPSDSPDKEEVNRMHCFVELANGEQADAAMAALDRKRAWDCDVRVKPAPEMLAERSGLNWRGTTGRT